MHGKFFWGKNLDFLPPKEERISFHSICGKLGCCRALIGFLDDLLLHVIGFEFMMLKMKVLQKLASKKKHVSFHSICLKLGCCRALIGFIDDKLLHVMGLEFMMLKVKRFTERGQIGAISTTLATMISIGQTDA
ncbi:hypothetical protein TNIN_472631 [Trichonephila inaurata madagascariensis]|uniref:Uncharacterized protein n=1 Tax=Trichonephila inaurata madagascariensis TaxID=2747483 RepID=A0A8X6KIU6_9ARAC|nr:hypothetical protein TNIN_472631 [Trichonephila inaurata madagascariensis]